MGDSLLEEDEEDDDSSSESVDEELKLTKNFVDALARIELNKNNYDEYVLLVSCKILQLLTECNETKLFLGRHSSRSNRLGEDPAEH